MQLRVVCQNARKTMRWTHVCSPLARPTTKRGFRLILICVSVIRSLFSELLEFFCGPGEWISLWSRTEVQMYKCFRAAVRHVAHDLDISRPPWMLISPKCFRRADRHLHIPTRPHTNTHPPTHPPRCSNPCKYSEVRWRHSVAARSLPFLCSLGHTLKVR